MTTPTTRHHTLGHRDAFESWLAANIGVLSMILPDPPEPIKLHHVIAAMRLAYEGREEASQ